MKPRWPPPLLWLALLGPALALPATLAGRAAAATGSTGSAPLAQAAPPAPMPRAQAPRRSGSPAAPEQEDIREIRGPVALAQPTPVWWWLVGGLGALTATAVLLRWRRRKPRALAPHERALAALAAQRRNPDPSPQAFSVLLSEAIRSYVEAAFPIRAAHRTTDELLAELMTDSSPVAAWRAELGVFLHHCDLAKFARWSLAPGDRDAMLDSAEAFVRATAATVAPVPTTLPPQSPNRAHAGAGHVA